MIGRSADTPKSLADYSKSLNQKADGIIGRDSRKVDILSLNSNRITMRKSLNQKAVRIIGRQTRVVILICIAISLALPINTATCSDQLPGEKESWIRVSTKHFSLISNASKRRALHVGQSLETLREVLGTTSGLKLYSPLETQIFVFKNSASMNPYNLGADGEPRSWVGYFLSTADGNYVAIDLSASRDPNYIVYHEYLHYVMRNNIPEIPLWLNEGLAEFYASFHVAGGKAYIGQPIREHLAWLSHNPLIPLEELLSADSDSAVYNEEQKTGTFYAQSWALTHYLVASSEESNSRLKDLLTLIKRGIDSKTALTRAYGVDLASLQKQLKQYVRSGSYGLYIHTPEEPFNEEQAVAIPLERKDVLVQLGDLLAHQQAIPFSSAYAHLNAALELDENLAEAYVVLAKLKLEDGQLSEAVECCERATALTPDNPRIYAIHGESLLYPLMESVEATGELPETPPPALVQAREKFRKSLELRPDHRPSLVGLGMTYLFTDGNLDEGVHAWARATQILPANSDFLANLIAITARSGNLDGARNLLQRGLRPRGEANQIRAAEGGLADAALQRAYELYEDGYMKEAKELLQRTLSDVGDPEVKKRISSELITFGAIETHNQVVDLYNRAIDEANADNFEQAAALMEQVVEQAKEPGLHEEARAKVETFRNLARRMALADRYHRALELLKEEDFDGSVEILREILKSDPDARLRQASEEALQEIDNIRDAPPN
jgi:tetratricopeptide (TPR) repeat protein